MSNILTELLKMKYPIISAPMAGVSGGQLARAVSNAGGFGFIGAGYADSSWLEQELKFVSEIAFGVGFITWQLAQKPELLALALQKNPTAIMLSFGDSSPFVDQIKSAGAKLICQVQTVKDAKLAAKQGADIIVAQGSEAGGHGSTRGTFALVPAIVDAVASIPVVAAGGIADGRGLAAAIMLGAQGALLGTRFYACTESLGHPNAKQAIIDATGDQTLRSNIFDDARALNWPSPFTARTLQNQFTQKWQAESVNKMDAFERARYQKALDAGDFSIAGVFAGEGIDLIDEILSAKEIVNRIMKEAKQAFERRL